MACNVKVSDFPNLMEKSIFNYFQELFILIGTTYADGVLLHNILNRFVQMLLASLFYFWFLLEKNCRTVMLFYVLLTL
jgi:hypothetical protein